MQYFAEVQFRWSAIFRNIMLGQMPWYQLIPFSTFAYLHRDDPLLFAAEASAYPLIHDVTQTVFKGGVTIYANFWQRDFATYALIPPKENRLGLRKIEFFLYRWHRKTGYDVRSRILCWFWFGMVSSSWISRLVEYQDQKFWILFRKLAYNVTPPLKEDRP